MSRTKYLKCACRHCGGHIEFPVAAAGMAATCPHCARDTDLPAAPSGHRTPWMVLSVGVVAAVFVAIAAGAYWWQQSQKSLAAKSVSAPETASETSPPPARVPATRAGSSNEFAVASFEIERTKGNSLVYVVGTVRNESARQRFGVKVEFDLLDGSGAKVGTTKDYAAVIEPRGAWRFKALVLDPKPVASARLAAIREEQ